MVSPTPHRFTNPAWELGDVFGWLLDRYPAKFGRILTEDDWRSALWQVNYTSFPRAKHDPEAATRLLHVLQRGELIAFDTSSQPVKPDFWLAKDERDLRAATRKYLFRREHILRLWPDPQVQTASRVPPPIEPLRGERNTVITDTLGNKTPDWSWWKHVPDVTLREAVSLSLNVDPTRSLELLAFHERREFEKRRALARRCVGASLAGPLNWKGVRYFDEEPVVKLRTFAAWAVSVVEWQVPPELLKLATDTRGPDRAPASKATSVEEVVYRTGVAGKPTSWHLIVSECRRRFGADERHPTTMEWATALRDWLRTAHPNAPAVTLKTLTNRLPALLRELKK
jgi:hypothetical protein